MNAPWPESPYPARITGITAPDAGTVTITGTSALYLTSDTQWFLMEPTHRVFWVNSESNWISEFMEESAAEPRTFEQWQQHAAAEIAAATRAKR